MTLDASTIRRWLTGHILELALFVVAGLLAALQPDFLSLVNLVNVIRQVAINGILSVGITFVLLTGGVDLSIGSVAALAGVMAAKFASADGVLPLVTGLAAGVVTGALCGLVNGSIIVRARVAPFVVTLGMMTAARGLALVVSDGRPISGLAPAFLLLAQAKVAGIPMSALIFLVLAIGAHRFLQNYRVGRYLYAIGGNEYAARAAGIPVARIKGFAYVVCGAAAGLGGAVLAARITTGQPNAGVGYELDAIAAAVIGGTSLSGGVGSIYGTALGALLIGTINNGLDLLDVSSYYQLIVKGAIITAAVCFDRKQLRDRS